MGIQIDQEELMRHILSIQPSYKEDQIDYQLFVRIVALSLETKNFNEQEVMLEEGYEQDLEEEKQWYNQ